MTTEQLICILDWVIAILLIVTIIGTIRFIIYVWRNQ